MGQYTVYVVSVCVVLPARSYLHPTYMYSTSPMRVCNKRSTLNTPHTCNYMITTMVYLQENWYKPVLHVVGVFDGRLQSLDSRNCYTCTCTCIMAFLR